jgi:hypothetical protein
VPRWRIAVTVGLLALLVIGLTSKNVASTASSETVDLRYSKNFLWIGLFLVIAAHVWIGDRVIRWIGASAARRQLVAFADFAAVVAMVILGDLIDFSAVADGIPRVRDKNLLPFFIFAGHVWGLLAVLSIRSTSAQEREIDTLKCERDDAEDRRKGAALQFERAREDFRALLAFARVGDLAFSAVARGVHDAAESVTPTQRIESFVKALTVGSSLSSPSELLVTVIYEAFRQRRVAEIGDDDSPSRLRVTMFEEQDGEMIRTARFNGRQYTDVAGRDHSRYLTLDHPAAPNLVVYCANHPVEIVVLEDVEAAVKEGRAPFTYFKDDLEASDDRQRALIRSAIGLQLLDGGEPCQPRVVVCLDSSVAGYFDSERDRQFCEHVREILGNRYGAWQRLSRSQAVLGAGDTP